MKTMQIVFDDELHRRLKHVSVDTGVTLANLVRKAVAAYCTQEEKKVPTKATVEAPAFIPFLDVGPGPQVVVPPKTTAPIAEPVAPVTVPPPEPIPEPVKPEQVPDPNQICRHRGYGAHDKCNQEVQDVGIVDKDTWDKVQKIARLAEEVMDE